MENFTGEEEMMTIPTKIMHDTNVVEEAIS